MRSATWQAEQLERDVLVLYPKAVVQQPTGRIPQNSPHSNDKNYTAFQQNLSVSDSPQISGRAERCLTLQARRMTRNDKRCQNIPHHRVLPPSSFLTRFIHQKNCSRGTKTARCCSLSKLWKVTNLFSLGLLLRHTPSADQRCSAGSME